MKISIVLLQDYSITRSLICEYKEIFYLTQGQSNKKGSERWLWEELCGPELSAGTLTPSPALSPHQQLAGLFQNNGLHRHLRPQS